MPAPRASPPRTKYTRLGDFVQRRRQPLKEFESAEALRKALLAGAVWLDTPGTDRTIPRFSLIGDSEPAAANSGNGWRAVHGLSVSPILSKVYQESGLRDRREA